MEKQMKKKMHGDAKVWVKYLGQKRYEKLGH